MLAKTDAPLAQLKRNNSNKSIQKNKPFGFDIQHLRLGGLKQRLVYCQKTLKRYIAGEIDNIPELEEPVLPYTSDDKRVGVIQYPKISSPCIHF